MSHFVKCLRVFLKEQKEERRVTTSLNLALVPGRGVLC